MRLAEHINGLGMVYQRATGRRHAPCHVSSTMHSCALRGHNAVCGLELSSTLDGDCPQCQSFCFPMTRQLISYFYSNGGTRGRSTGREGNVSLKLALSTSKAAPARRRHRKSSALMVTRSKSYSSLNHDRNACSGAMTTRKGLYALTHRGVCALTAL